MTLLSLALLLAVSANSPAADDYQLKASSAIGKFQRVKAALEVTGKLKLNADGSQISKLPIKVKAELLYDERLLSPDQDRNRHARYYHKGQAVIQVGKTRKQTTLPEDRRLMVAQAVGQSLNLFSPLGPLTRETLELVDIQGSSSVLDRLLPSKRVQISDQWENNDTTIALLLGLEIVHQNDTRSTLRSVEGSVAIVKMQGVVSGSIGGVSTDIELEAIYNFDLQQGQVTWLAMSIQEQRAIGHAQPGIAATARLRVAVAPIDESPHLTDAALADFPLQYQAGSALLDFHSQPGGFRFLHGRNWQLMVDRHDVSILRLIERGDLIAQCNASNLPLLKREQQVRLDVFQADVKRALGGRFSEFVAASETTSDGGLRVLRTVVSGVVAELPIQWTYYHLSDGTGRQAALVFTLDAKLVERFAEAEQTLISSFEFLDLPEPGTEKPQSRDTDATRAANRPAAAPIR